MSVETTTIVRGELIEIGSHDPGDMENGPSFVRIGRKEGDDIVISGLTADEARSMAACFFQDVVLTVRPAP